MTVRRTFSSLAFASDTDNPELPVEWAGGAAVQILDLMWRSFDCLLDKQLAGINLVQPLDQLERDLARHHFVELQLIFFAETEGFSSFVPTSEWPEFESLSSSQAKPPANDFAFIHFVHQRWAWPIEAKVLPTPGTLAEYMKDVREKFESGVAAPLVGEGGMIGYLLTGTPESFFNNLQSAHSLELAGLAEFATRAHRLSIHARSSAPTLRLHHMVMKCC